MGFNLIRYAKLFSNLHQFIMPTVEDELTKTSGSAVYESVDFTNSYCQLPIHTNPKKVCPSSTSGTKFVVGAGQFLHPKPHPTQYQ